MKLDNYECEGQLNLTDYLKSKIISNQIKDLTNWINSQGKAQYTQIGEVISRTYEQEKDTNDLIDRLTNAVSVYVLNQSMGDMKYLKNESEL